MCGDRCRQRTTGLLRPHQRPRRRNRPRPQRPRPQPRRPRRQRRTPRRRPAAGSGSMFDKAWAFDPSSPRYDVSLYAPNYFLVGRYTTDLNTAPYDPLVGGGLLEPGTELDAIEAAFQLSFKFRLWTTDDRRWGAWVAYTQQSQWQLYNDTGNASRPFRETNYMPELILSYKPALQWGDLQWNLVNLAFNHQSNGRSDTAVAQLEPPDRQLRRRAAATWRCWGACGGASPNRTTRTTTRRSPTTTAGATCRRSTNGAARASAARSAATRAPARAPASWPRPAHRCSARCAATSSCSAATARR